jgi:dihydrodipicolinate synthase/N-acetylneuraminate lyase
MCKYWGELMGLRHGHVRAPLSELSDEDKAELKQDLESVLK